MASLFIAIGPAQAAGPPLAPAPAPAVSGQAAPSAPAVHARPAAQPAATVLHSGEQYVIADKTLCSTGFAVTSATGRDGFVSAGHCGAAGDAVQTSSGAAMGTFVASSFPRTDYGWVATNARYVADASATRHNGTVAAVRGDAAAPVGSRVCMSGQASGWHCGTITAVNQSVNYDQGIVSGLTATTVCTDAGDSGGVFLSGDQAQGIVSGGIGDCSSHGTTYFQPVVPILQAYGLTLRTG